MEDISLGKERETLIKIRVNQNFFRSTILSSYNSKCCVTGLSIPEFLVASHIIPWSKDKVNRTNPHNGLCLNSIHDKAFDKGFMTIGSDYKIILSDAFEDYSKDTIVQDFFLKFDRKKIEMPDRFLPSLEFLAYHRKYIFLD